MSISFPIDISGLRLKHRQWTIAWHSLHQHSEIDEPFAYIEANHSHNFSLWHEEDIARRTDLSPEAICNAKRNIDRYNQKRNDAMEQIDDFILKWINSLGAHSSQLLHSETPGMIIDRLSIMALKEFHMLEETLRSDASELHRNKCTVKVKILQEQQSDLASALHCLLEDLASGRKHFKVYRQLKMYNDPTLNPQLYNPTAL